MRGFGGLALLVLAIGAILRYWWVLAIIVGVIAVLALLWWLVRWLDRRLDAWDAKRTRTRGRLAAIAHRADQQHAWVLAGDDRGIYGDYLPEQVIELVQSQYRAPEFLQFKGIF